MSREGRDGRPLDRESDRLSTTDLFESLGSLSLGVARRILDGRYDLAEDAVQEAFLRIDLKLREGFRPDSPQGWVLWIVRNEALRLRRSWRHETLDSDPPGNSEPDPLVLREENERLHQALASLPEQDRQVLTLRFLQGMKPGRARKLLGMSKTTFWELTRDARNRLRRELDSFAAGAEGE